MKILKITTLLIGSLCFLGNNLSQAADSIPLWSNGTEYNQNAQLQAGWADAFFLKHYPFKGDEHILDIGAGDGKITVKIAQAVPKGRVIGIDNSQSMLAKAKIDHHQTPNLQYILEDAQNQEFYKQNANQFDLVVSFSTLHWVKNQQGVLDGIYQVLKPNGKFYVKLCSKGGDPIQDIADSLKSHPKFKDKFKDFIDPVTRFNESEYLALVQKAKLQIISIKDTEEKDKVANSLKLSNQLKSWLPHYHFLKRSSPELAEEFMKDTINLYIQQYPAKPDGSIMLYDHYLEVVGEKRAS